MSESDVCGRKREQQLPAHAAALGGGPTPRRRDAYLEPLDGETLTQSLSPTSCTLTKRATRVRAKCLHLPHWATTHVPVTPVTPVTCAFLIRGGPRRPAGGAGRFRSYFPETLRRVLTSYSHSCTAAAHRPTPRTPPPARTTPTTRRLAATRTFDDGERHDDNDQAAGARYRLAHSRRSLQAARTARPPHSRFANEEARLNSRRHDGGTITMTAIAATSRTARAHGAPREGAACRASHR